MNIKGILSLGTAVGLAALAGCGNKADAPKCEVTSDVYHVTIACEQPYFRFEASQPYGKEFTTKMHYQNGLGDTVELVTDNMPASYNETAHVFFFHVLKHYGYATYAHGEEPTERQKKLMARLSDKWLKECRQANCIEEVAKWLETGATIEERFRSRLGWDASAHSNPVCQTTMKQRQLNVKCETFELAASDWGLGRIYRFKYKNNEGHEVEIEADMPLNYGAVPRVSYVSGLGVAGLGLNREGKEEWALLAEDAGEICLQLCQNINCIEANNEWLSWRADIQPGDEANLERTDYPSDGGYQIWQMVPNRKLSHSSRTREAYNRLVSYSEPEQTEIEYVDDNAEGNVDKIRITHRNPYSYQSCERGDEGTEAMFEAADAELAQAKREMGAE